VVELLLQLGAQLHRPDRVRAAGKFLAHPPLNVDLLLLRLRPKPNSHSHAS
jgi:hypothetical protein